MRKHSNNNHNENTNNTNTTNNNTTNSNNNAQQRAFDFDFLLAWLPPAAEPPSALFPSASSPLSPEPDVLSSPPAPWAAASACAGEGRRGEGGHRLSSAIHNSNSVAP